MKTILEMWQIMKDLEADAKESAKGGDFDVAIQCLLQRAEIGVEMIRMCITYADRAEEAEVTNAMMYQLLR